MLCNRVQTIIIYGHCKKVSPFFPTGEEIMTVLLPYVVYFLWIFKIRGDIYYYILNGFFLFRLMTKINRRIIYLEANKKAL